MFRMFFRLIIWGIIAALLLAAYGWYDYTQPGPLTSEKTVIFTKGNGFNAIVDQLGTEGVIRRPLLFKLVAVAQGSARKFKAGEYDFSPAIPASLVMQMIAEGKVVIHKVTIPEGLTVQEVKAILEAEKALDGDISTTIAEGSLMPETYHFTYGDKRQDIIARMQAAMSALLAEQWAKRKDGLPLANPQQALTLASIVEKETGVDNERPKVASVFINRLRQGMKLQTDPTVTYGIEKDKGPMKHALTLDDLGYNSPYNTYVIDGLPPGPICNPGRAAVIAALNPADTDYLYFVATGKGGHNFASSLKEHNNNVESYHRALKSKD